MPEEPVASARHRIVSGPWSTNARAWAAGLAVVLALLAVGAIVWRIGGAWPTRLVVTIAVVSIARALWRAASGRADDGGGTHRLF